MVAAKKKVCHEFTVTIRTDLRADKWVGHVVVVDADVASNATCPGIVCMHR